MAMTARKAFPLVLAAALTVAGCAAAENRTKKPGPVADLVQIERQANEAYVGRRYEEAAQLYRTMTEQMPGEAEYWYRLANSLVRTDRQNDAAIAYQQTLRLDPDNAKAWHNLGIVRLHQAQASFAESVQNSKTGERAFDESLKLSTAVFSLIKPDSGQGSAGNDAPGDPHDRPAGAKRSGTQDTQAGG